MSDAIKALLELMKQDPRTTWLAGVVVALLAAGKALSEYGLEPWGTCVSGLGGFVAAGVLLVSRFAAKPKPQEPPEGPPDA